MGKFKQERVLPDEEDGQYIIHKVRYRFAAARSRGCRVLDAASGAGYGARMLAEAADHVVAVDRDKEIVLWARERYGADNVHFASMDVTRFALASDSFDLVVALQILEHVREADRFVAEIYRVLRPGGTAIFSTENQEVHYLHLKSAGQPDADSHCNVMTISQFRALLGNSFDDVRYLCQRPRRPWYHTVLKSMDVFNLRLRWTRPKFRAKVLEGMGSPVQTVGREEDYVISPYLIGQAPIQIAVCGKAAN